MSYEGYEQVLCKNGHLGSADAYFGHHDWQCPDCGTPDIAWSNSVDDTNGERFGYIHMEQFLIRPARFTWRFRWNGSVKGFVREETDAEVYRIPGERETLTARTYEDGGKEIPVYDLDTEEGREMLHQRLEYNRRWREALANRPVEDKNADQAHVQDS